MLKNSNLGVIARVLMKYKTMEITENPNYFVKYVESVIIRHS